MCIRDSINISRAIGNAGPGAVCIGIVWRRRIAHIDLFHVSNILSGQFDFIENIFLAYNQKTFSVFQLPGPAEDNAVFGGIHINGSVIDVDDFSDPNIVILREK